MLGAVSRQCGGECEGARGIDRIRLGVTGFAAAVEDKRKGTGGREREDLWQALW